MNRLILIIMVFLFFNVSAEESNSSVEASDNVNNSICIPPFTNMLKSESNAGKQEFLFEMVKSYFEQLHNMKLRPFFCNEKEFAFRVIQIIWGGMRFTNTSIQIYKESGSFFIRISTPFSTPPSQKYNCISQRKSEFLVYKMNAEEANKILGKITNSEILKTNWTLDEFKDTESLKPLYTERVRPWALLFEGVSEKKYHSAYSPIIMGDVLDAILKKEKSDSNLATFTRELFGFAYEKILTGDVRYFEFDKKWEELKPFEGCKSKEEQKKTDQNKPSK